MKRLGIRGDTIIEVILAMTVVGVLLTSSYNIANKSLTSARQAQERGEALKIAEGQVEKIKTVAGENFSTLQQPGPFCVNDSLVLFIPSCVNGRYRYTVNYQSGGGSPSQDIFTVTTTWDRAGGGGQDTLRLIYKVHR